MASNEWPPEFLARLAAVTRLRPKRVIEHILEHGFVTTEQLKSEYGYNHPPRAARDVREAGIVLETFRVSATDGRKIGAYRFANPDLSTGDRFQGRVTFPKRFKQELIYMYGAQCAICSSPYEDRYLQIDHRIPYEVLGDALTDGLGKTDRATSDYMLLDGSCNRAKSWSCEHCSNWMMDRDPEVCQNCYWAHPEAYKHVARRSIRRLELEWSGEEIADHEKLRLLAQEADAPLPDYVKHFLKAVFDRGQ